MMNSIRNTVKDKLSPSVTNMIRMDHTHVVEAFHQYEIDSSPQTKKALVNTVCLALEIHSQLEEEIFYPAMRTLAADTPVVNKSIPEHNEMRHLISELRSMDPLDAHYDQTFMQLMRVVMHHVAEEETTLLPDAERLMPDRLGELGMQMTKRRLQLTAPRAGEIAVNTVRGFPTSSMLVAAGALLAGTYFAKRAFEGQARHRHN
ncbi:MAG TPA: hemerythrin domain-containing protein [Noviherbaspirillum sp.]|uniref:hemerythrin domain-containing protein n=1 Tax=Noviherbaspirillum sp. TaxID=1926288 RepID=UPI002B4756DE|nr:hemerythrin domain-containing protein [Noviherbaspirillum sp.]HJV85153.1 hemerythrin domain-containing protein [Noviherbaspirillum sp.]